MRFHELRRSRLLLPAVLVGGIATLFVGWYSLTDTSRSFSPSRYVEGIVGEPRRPSPLFARGHPPDEDLVALLFSGLVRIAGDGTPLPDLADTWAVTPDGRTYSFRLRDDLYWHDGEHVRSSDVAFTVARVQQPGFQGPATLALRWAGIDVQTPDPRTVIFRLPEARADFLSQTALGVVPEHLLAGLGVLDLLESPHHQTPVGNGPYRLVELSTERALLERNPSYHRGSPTIDEIELRFFSSPAALEAGLAGGEVSGALLEEGRHQQASSVLALRPDLRAVDLPRNSFTVLYLNNGRPPLDDARTRSAIVASIDRAALLALAPGATPGTGPIVPLSWAHSPVDLPDPAQAAERFTAAGWLPDESGVLTAAGHRLGLSLVTNAEPARVAFARLVAEQLRAQGMVVTVEAIPAAELVGARLGLHDYDLALFGWEAAVDPDPYSGWHTSQIPPPGRNVAAYHDHEADGMLEAARQTLDITERRALYAAFAERFVEQAASAVLLYPARTYIVPATLRGIEPGLLFRPASRFRDIHSLFFEGTAAAQSPAPVP